MSFWCILPSSVTGSDGVVYFSVEVGIQSVQGERTRRIVQRRYREFRALAAQLRKELGDKKALPELPPKQPLSRVSENSKLIDERRKALEAWLWRLMADVQVAHSAALSDFLELPAARRGLSQARRASAAAGNGGARSASPAPSSLPVSEHSAAAESTPPPAPPPADAPGWRRGPDSDTSSDTGGPTSRAPSTFGGPSPSHGPRRSIALPAEASLETKRLLHALGEEFSAVKGDLTSALSLLASERAVKELLAAQLKEAEAQLAEARRLGTVAGGGESSSAKAAQGVGTSAPQAPAQSPPPSPLQPPAEGAPPDQAPPPATPAPTHEAAQQQEQPVGAPEPPSPAPPAPPAGPSVEEVAAQQRMLAERKALSREIKALRKQVEQAESARAASAAEAEQLRGELREQQRVTGAVEKAVRTVLREAENIQQRLRESSVETISADSVHHCSSDFMEALDVSDGRVGLLLAEAQLVSQCEAGAQDDAGRSVEGTLREFLGDVLCESASLRKTINTLLRSSVVRAEHERSKNGGEHHLHK